ncbi:molecular chaperone HtpG [Alkalilimnicola ehrlichii]|uniref:Chaperone protein HtpG n=1 Tax=Alkalilimnicola ehrlichii TaxID=351052 RepID=A0A3E0X068_9GAMM|nr:molecular chaperone HtpG [Alkalilimnicola ehrlichii]RFA30863.1 molecular chaperone HtpG [Alkalilimnicola ehrlichii]RFA38814.1 molecular chaperone HtpG [Alkalilimnicola ehrlichii]
MSVEAEKENLSFQAEVQQLLNLMIHSLYSNKEIFLRELVSNASDAADKLRFQALKDEALYEGDAELSIRVAFDKDARTITIKDNGIGMTRDEVVENLGTIARSGTRQFLEALTGDEAKDAQLIGQFGVGFYSAFVVADRVTVLTRKAGDKPQYGVRWESDGQGGYTIANEERPERGTEVILHLREGEDEFLDAFRLRHIIRTYSDHISIPILMDGEGEEAGEEKVNRASALWMRPKQDISEDEYHEFYKHVAHDFEPPLAYIHNKVEGNLSYTSLLYIPQRAPFDLWDRDQAHGIKLYVKRVFIMDDAEHLMPRYLRFVRGVIDSDDLPLNVSREILQHNRMLDRIRSASVKRVLDLLETMAKNEPEQYAGFWQTFGRVLKEGPAEDFGNRERIAKLLRFSSTHEAKEAADVSFDQYLERMGEGQDKIYYLTADSFKAAVNSPHLEVFRKKGLEVLLLTDPVDEWLVAHLENYNGKPLQSVAKGELDLGELEDKEAKEELDKAADEYKPLLERFEKALADQVRDVRVSHRLTDSPSCLVVDDHEFGIGMQRILRAAGHDLPQARPTLEVNPQHPLVKQLVEEKDDERFKNWAEVLFEQALLTEGGQLEDPASFVKRVNSLLMQTG